MRFWEMIGLDPTLGRVISGAYDPPLVMLSISAASLAAYASLAVVGRLTNSRKPSIRMTWLTAGGFAMGAGIWAMHFTAMLAFKLPAAVNYDFQLTLLSLVPAMIGSGFALHFMSKKVGLLRMQLGALLLALGIGLMHYTGMDAMRMDAYMRYDPFLFALSIVVAHVLASVALYIRFAIHTESMSLWKKVASAVAMGCAVSGMHYTAMAAAQFYEKPGATTVGMAFPPGLLALLIGGFVSVIIGLMILGTIVDRRLEEAAANLQASKTRQQTILGAMADGVITIDEFGIIETFNPAAERIFGFTAVEMLGQNIRTIMPEPRPSHHDQHLEPYQNDAEGHATGQRREMEALHKDGSPVPVELMISEMHIDGRKLFTGVVRDIAERRRAEKEHIRFAQQQEIVARLGATALEEPNISSLMHTAVRSAAAGLGLELAKVLILDPNGRSLKVTAGIGWKAGVVGTASVPADDSSQAGYTMRVRKTVIVDDLETETRFSSPVLLMAHDVVSGMSVPMISGQRVVGVLGVHSRARCAYSEADANFLESVAHIVATAIERKRIEDELQRLAMAVDQARDAIVVTDAEGTIEYVNPAFVETSGFSSQETVGRPLCSLQTQSDLAEAEADGMAKAIRGGREWAGTVTSNKKNGSTFQEEVTMSPVRDDSGDTSKFVVVKRDISERAELEAHLRQAQKLESIGQLAAGVAHEINTPMQYINDNTVFLKRCFGGALSTLKQCRKLIDACKQKTMTPEQLEAADTAYAKAKIALVMTEVPRAIDQSLEGLSHVSSIVCAMKEFSHPSQGQKQLVDLHQCIKTTLTVARNEWKYVAEIATDFDPDLPLVPCLRNEFNQVILNMVVNASHAIADVIAEKPDDKGVITIQTRRDGDFAEIRVMDTGGGISADIQRKVFDPFFTTKGVGKGTGQGLAIARSVIVDKHGGTVAVDSSPGNGATFIIRLPLKDASSSVAEHRKAA